MDLPDPRCSAEQPVCPRAPTITRSIRTPWSPRPALAHFTWSETTARPPCPSCGTRPLHRGLPQRSVSAWRARLALRRSGAGAHRRIVAGETTDKDDALLSFLQRHARPRTRGDQAELLVAKSVHGMFCLEIPTAVAEVDVVLVRRHPLNVVASWLGLGWMSDGVDRAPSLIAASDLDESTMLDGPDTPLTRTVRSVAILERQMRLLAEANPSWVVADHDDLCRHADGGFRKLYEQLGLAWHPSVSGALADRDTPGTGYATKRVASDLPDQWKRRLDDEQLAMANSCARTMRALMATYLLLHTPRANHRWRARDSPWPCLRPPRGKRR